MSKTKKFVVSYCRKSAFDKAQLSGKSIPLYHQKVSAADSDAAVVIVVTSRDHLISVTGAPRGRPTALPTKTFVPKLPNLVLAAKKNLGDKIYRQNVTAPGGLTGDDAKVIQVYPNDSFAIALIAQPDGAGPSAEATDETEAPYRPLSLKSRQRAKKKARLTPLQAAKRALEMASTPSSVIEATEEIGNMFDPGVVDTTPLDEIRDVFSVDSEDADDIPVVANAIPTDTLFQEISAPIIKELYADIAALETRLTDGEVETKLDGLLEQSSPTFETPDDAFFIGVDPGVQKAEGKDPEKIVVWVSGEGNTPGEWQWAHKMEESPTEAASSDVAAPAVKAEPHNAAYQLTLIENTLRRRIEARKDLMSAQAVIYGWQHQWLKRKSELDGLWPEIEPQVALDAAIHALDKDYGAGYSELSNVLPDGILTSDQISEELASLEASLASAKNEIANLEAKSSAVYREIEGLLILRARLQPAEPVTGDAASEPQLTGICIWREYDDADADEGSGRVSPLDPLRITCFALFLCTFAGLFVSTCPNFTRGVFPALSVQSSYIQAAMLVSIAGFVLFSCLLGREFNRQDKS